MGKIKNWMLEEYWYGYSVFEKLFMICMLALQIIVFMITPDSIVGIICGISGIISVVLCAKGKISFYYIGFIQTFTYLYLAWNANFYGEVMENLFYLVTMVWGIFLWKSNMTKTKEGSREVKVNKFTTIQWVEASIITIIATVALGFGLDHIGNAQAYTDAATNIFAIFGQLMMIKRYREQWIWWLLVDLFCIKLWVVAGNWSMVAMYIGWTVNCIYGWYNWSKLNNIQTVYEDNSKNELSEQLY